MTMEIHDSPAGKFTGRLGRHIVDLYDGQDVVWDFSYDDGKDITELDFVVYCSYTDVFTHVYSTFDWDTHDIEEELREVQHTVAGVHEFVDEITEYTLNYVFSQDHLNALYDWLSNHGYMLVNSKWVKPLEGDYEE